MAMIFTTTQFPGPKKSQASLLVQHVGANRQRSPDDVTMEPIFAITSAASHTGHVLQVYATVTVHRVKIFDGPCHITVTADNLSMDEATTCVGVWRELMSDQVEISISILMDGVSGEARKLMAYRLGAPDPIGGFGTYQAPDIFNCTVHIRDEVDAMNHEAGRCRVLHPSPRAG